MCTSVVIVVIFKARSNEDFRSRSDVDYHVGEDDTLFCKLTELDIVKDVVLDYMHLVCLGVTRKLFVTLWLCGKPPHKFSSKTVEILSSRMLAIKKFVPSDFVRRPRSNSSFNDEVQLTNETIKTMPIIMIDHDITNLHQSSDLSQPSVTSFRALSRQSGTSDSNSEVQNDTTAFERQVMRQLVLLNAKVNQQTETLNYILEKLNQGTAVPLQNQEYTNFLQSDFFPIGSIEALENMEEQLQDEAKKKQLIIDLKKLGGEDTKKMIRRMLERLLTFKLGSMYTWDGARGKRVFGTLSISQVIKSACATTQRHNTTEDEVERFIKEWLRRAKERCIQTEKKRYLSDNLKIAEAESISRIAQKHTDIILSEPKDANCEHILPVSTDVESCTLKENVSPQSSSIILDSASDKSDSLFAWAKTDSKTNKDVSLSNSFQDYKISGLEYAPSDSSSSSSESSVDSNADIEKEFSTNVLSYLRNSKVATHAKKTNIVPKSNCYMYANPGSENKWMAGTNVIRRLAKNCEAKLLTSTKFRKHIATTLQLMNMQPDEMEQLATFMRHTKKTHSEFYRKEIR
ncbi:hypothetical protein RN001_002489 [Aquatica leii]|uniref:DUF4806 domain-containing protein n=1 Tax=Aquatica leii TaxID=1421715 RepID=A0AAN7QNJ0_9COLE|nr:hypothetical protein RN001_002489 [Aquatica leii]